MNAIPIPNVTPAENTMRGESGYEHFGLVRLSSVTGCALGEIRLDMAALVALFNGGAMNGTDPLEAADATKTYIILKPRIISVTDVDGSCKNMIVIGSKPY